MLKKSLLIALVSLAPALASAQTAPQPAAPRQWITCITLEGGYRIDMPGLAASRTEKIELKGGRTATLVVSELEQGNLAFLASHIDYPKDYLAADSQAVLNSVRDAKFAGKKLVRERALDARGREYLVFDEGMYLVVRMILVGDRLYQAIAAGGRTADFDKDPAIRRFLDSFMVGAG